MTFNSKSLNTSSPTSFAVSVVVHSGLLCTLLVFLGQAQAASPINVDISGFYSGNLSVIDSNNENNDTGMSQDAEIYFSGATYLENGLKLGFNVQLEAGDKPSDPIDESYIYVEGAFGRFMLGSENGASVLGSVQAPAFIAGLKMWDNNLTGEFIEDNLSSTGHQIDDVHMSTFEEHFSSDEQKIIYFTPRVAGLRAGVSYAPNNANRNGGENNSAVTSAQDNITSYSLDYRRQVSDAFSFDVSFGKTMSANAAGATASGVGALGDPETDDIGIKLSYGDIVFAAHQSSYDNYGGDLGRDIETTNFTVAYNQNKTTLGFGYTDSSDAGVVLVYVPVDYEEWLIGGSTEVADGVAIGYYYQGAQADYADGNSVDVAIVGATLALKF